MEIELIRTMEITDLETELGVQLKIREKPKKIGLMPFYVQFEDSEVKASVGFQKGIFGSGQTIDAALLDYAKKISERRIVVNVEKRGRVESLFVLN